MRRSIAAAAVAVTALLLLPQGTALADDPPRYQTYYSIFTRGAAHIPYLDTTPYVPQGLAYWPARDAMIVSYYHEDGGNARLAILDRTTSRHLKTLVLADTGHAQALAVSTNYLWLATTGRMVRYSLADVALTADGATLRENADYVLEAHSFVEITGSKMYVGSFHTDANGTAYRYTLDAAENPVYDDHSFTVPPKVQGMAITPTHFVWSRSYGQDADSELTVDPRAGAITRRLVAPNMSEDLATVGGELYVVYESGARKYAGADYKVRTIHHGPLAELIP
jgi:hypothetical protein